MAKTIREEDLRLNIIVNGDNGKKQLLEVRDRLAGLNAERDREIKLHKEVADWEKRRPLAYQNQAKRIEKLNQQIKEQEEKEKSLIRQQKIETMTMKELARHIKLTTIALREAEPGTENWRKLNDELAKSKKRYQELASQSKNTESLLTRVWNSAAGGVLILQKVIDIAKKTIQRIARAMGSIMDFEQANANLSAILRVNADEMSRLTDNAIELGRRTEYTSTQVTGLQTELAKLGFTQREILDMTEPTLAFATAVGADLPEAAAFAGAALRAFGLRSEDTTDMLEVMAAATTRSALDFGKLQTGISIVGPVARSFGMDVRETVSLLGVLSNAGFDASSGATALRNIFLETAKAGGKVQQAMGGEVRSFDDLADGMKRLRERGLDLAQANDLVGKRAASAFLVLADGIETARGLRAELSEVNGELDKMHKKQLNTLHGSVELLKSAWDGLKLSFRDSTGWMKTVIDGLTAAVDLLNRALFRAARVAHKKEGFAGQIQEIADAGGDVAADLGEQNEKVNAAGARSENHWTRFIPFYRHITKRVAKEIKERKEAFEEAAADWAEGDGFVGPVRPGTKTVDTTVDEDPDPETPRAAWSLQNDKAFLEAKVKLTRQYGDGEIKDQEAYNVKLLELEIATLTARIALRKESGADRLQLEQQLLDKTHQQQENARKKEEQLAKEKAQVLADIETDAAKKARAQEDVRYAEEQKKYQGNAEMLELIEKKHRQNLAKIRIEAENTWLKKQQEQHDLERKQLENEYTRKIAEAQTAGEESMLKREMSAALAALDLSYLEDLRKHVKAIVDSGEFDGIVLTDEQKREFEKKLTDIIAQINAADSALKGEGRTKRGIGGGSLFGVAQSQWEQFFRNLREGKAGAEDMLIALNGIGGIAQQGFQLASQAIAMTNAKEQEELKAYQKANETKRKDLQKRLDTGLMTQAQYGAEIEKMEAEQEAREEEMALRQAEREKRMNIAQAIIQTALAVTKTFVQWGGWPSGLAPAAIMGALGAAQVALISSTPVSGRERGGPFDQDARPVRVRRRQDGRTFPARLSPDRRGYIDRPTVLVGENGTEYVIPAEALQNPSVAPFVDAIETARRNGRLRDLRLEAVQPRLAIAGRASGGFFDDYAAAGSMGGSVTMPDGTRLSAANYQELLQLLRRMNVIFSKPIKAEVAMLGRKGIIEKTEEYNRAKRGGQLNG